MTRLRFVGDAAICLDVDGPTPLDSNLHVHRLADQFRVARLPGVRDVVPGMTTLTVHIDPMRTDFPQLEALVATATADDLSTTESVPRVAHEVPVRYGGAAGPDLDDVARTTGLAASRIVDTHLAGEYRVCFLGFQPGFAYLGPVSDTLRIGRRATPRSRVPAGAVAIAEIFTGIYPSASPGGWHIIGHTDLPLFDERHLPPARFAPGDLVRFVKD